MRTDSSLLKTLVASMVDKHTPQAFMPDQMPESAERSRTSRLIFRIEQCPGVSTTELSHWIGLNSSLVWGLLKHARATGRIEHSVTGGWRISTARDDQQTADAVALLRARGWQCLPPNGKEAP